MDLKRQKLKMNIYIVGVKPQKNIMKKKKKEFGVPALIPSYADGFKKASDEQTRKGIRSQMGKGDKRRVEDTQAIRDNWPLAGCKNNLGNKSE